LSKTLPHFHISANSVGKDPEIISMLHSACANWGWNQGKIFTCANGWWNQLYYSFAMQFVQMRGWNTVQYSFVMQLVQMRGEAQYNIHLLGNLCR